MNRLLALSMVEMGTGELFGALAVAISSGAAVFWLGHLRADVLRAKEDVRLLQSAVADLRLEVSLMARLRFATREARESLKNVQAPIDPEED